MVQFGWVIALYFPLLQIFVKAFQITSEYYPHSWSIARVSQGLKSLYFCIYLAEMLQVNNVLNFNWLIEA